MDDDSDATDVEILDQEITDYRHRLGLIHSATLTKILGLYQDTLKQWRGADRGPNYVRIGKRVWYLFDDVKTWLEEEKVMTTQRRDYNKMNKNPDDVQPPPQNKPRQNVNHDPSNPAAAEPRCPVCFGPMPCPDHPISERAPDPAEDNPGGDDGTFSHKVDNPGIPPESPRVEEPPITGDDAAVENKDGGGTRLGW